MSKILIAVCDRDGSYGERLGEWISLQRGERLQSVSFSSPECFLEYQNSKKQDIVLLGRGFNSHPKICEEILKGDKDGGVLWIYLRDDDGGEPIPDCIRELASVEKYQSASGILRDIFSIYQKQGDRLLEETERGKEVIGIYSPQHSIWQTPFALTLAQTIAGKERVLYVNLQECAGFRGWFHEEYEKDLLDVMYLCLSNEVDVAHCVRSALYTIEGVDYIPPAEDGVCLGEICAQDYLKFVELLVQNSGYDVIVLDFGMMIPGFFKLLEACSIVYVATEPGELPEAPLQHFRQMVTRQEDTELRQKLSYLSLPSVHAENCPGTGKMQQWLWGTIGDFSRGLLGVARGTD